MNSTHSSREVAVSRSRLSVWHWGVLALVVLSSSCDLSPRAAAASPPTSSAPTAAPATCPTAPIAPGYASCDAVEITGSPPCESICRRPRKVAQPDNCCTDPVEVAVFSGTRVLLKVDACTWVSPECAHVHGHGRMDANLRVLTTTPPELIVVEGGCEMRAMAHGYVPKGVAAWTGCRHDRYRWNGKDLVKQSAPN